jgi:hypothetical protein
VKTYPVLDFVEVGFLLLSSPISSIDFPEERLDCVSKYEGSPAAERRCNPLIIKEIKKGKNRKKNLDF